MNQVSQLAGLPLVQLTLHGTESQETSYLEPRPNGVASLPVGSNPMPDEDDPFRAAQQAHEADIHRCALCKQVQKLSVTRRRQLRDAMFGKTKVNGKTIGHRVIVEVLTSWGVETSLTTVSNHAGGGTQSNPLSRACREQVALAWGADNGE